MKFQRQAKIFRGQVDVAPFAAVFFLMIGFVVMGSFLYTPGVVTKVSPPVADGFSGTDNPTIMMAVTARGQFLLDNQVLDDSGLKPALQKKVDGLAKTAKGLTLVLMPDKAVTYEVLVKVRAMAKEAGILEVLEGVTPSAYSAKAK